MRTATQEVKKHNLFSASAASRWMACPASIGLSKTAPPSRESGYAEEGTKAHALLEALMKGDDEALQSDEYSAEMEAHALNALEAIHGMTPEGATVLSETKCSLDFIHPDMGGTTDCAIIEPYGKLIVIDFKYGVVPVDPKENPQLIAYALSLAHRYDFEFSSVELVIIQPRALDAEENGIVKSWVTSVSNLKLWELKFKVASDKAISKDAYKYIESGEHCKYCPASPICPSLRDKNLIEIQADFCSETGSIALPVAPSKAAKAIPNLGKILDACDRLETWMGAVRAHAYHVLETGGHVEGYKLVQKRAIRKWSDPDLAARLAKKHFKEEAFSEPELLSPAQFEKAVGSAYDKDIAKDFVDMHSEAKSSGTTIAPEDDPRPTYNLFEAEFQSLKEGGEECEKNASVAEKITSKSRSYSCRSATNAPVKKPKTSKPNQRKKRGK